MVYLESEVLLLWWDTFTGKAYLLMAVFWHCTMACLPSVIKCFDLSCVRWNFLVVGWIFVLGDQDYVVYRFNLHSRSTLHKIDHCCSFSAYQGCEGGTGIMHKPRLNGICTGQPQHRICVIFSIHSHYTVAIIAGSENLLLTWKYVKSENVHRPIGSIQLLLLSISSKTSFNISHLHFQILPWFL